MTSHRPELHGRFGMAASTHWLGTATAMSVLERGGNAFDAAVAMGPAVMVCAFTPGAPTPAVVDDIQQKHVNAVRRGSGAPAE